MQISVIIPAYNEDERIEDTIKKVHSYLSSRNYDFEIIVVDDGSTDDTLKIIKSTVNITDRTRVIHYDLNKGYGFAVKTGMLSANGEIAMYLDADMSIPIEEMGKFKEWFDKGYQLVIGSKRLERSYYVKKMSLLRSFLGRGYAVLSNLILFTHISDFTCGFKMFKKGAYNKIFPKQRLNRWGFSCEVIFIALKNGFKVKEVPIKCIHRVDSRVRIVRDIAFSFIEMLTIRFNSLVGKYKIRESV